MLINPDSMFMCRLFDTHSDSLLYDCSGSLRDTSMRRDCTDCSSAFIFLEPSHFFNSGYGFSYSPTQLKVFAGWNFCSLLGNKTFVADGSGQKFTALSLSLMGVS